MHRKVFFGFKDQKISEDLLWCLIQASIMNWFQIELSGKIEFPKTLELDAVGARCQLCNCGLRQMPALWRYKNRWYRLYSLQQILIEIKSYWSYQNIHQRLLAAELIIWDGWKRIERCLRSNRMRNIKRITLQRLLFLRLRSRPVMSGLIGNLLRLLII